jgi:hypothetical protein
MYVALCPTRRRRSLITAAGSAFTAKVAQTSGAIGTKGFLGNHVDDEYACLRDGCKIYVL